MMKPKTQSTLAIGIMLMIFIIAMITWPYKSEASIIVLAGVGVFSSVWYAVRMIHVLCKKDWINSTSRREILFAIILAGLLLLGSISATLFKELDVIDHDMTKRIGGVLIGLMLVCMGNYMPKKQSQQRGTCCNTSDTKIATGKASKIQRFMGWTFVIAGVLYAMIWMLVDLEKTSIATMLTFPAAVLLIVLARVVYLRVSKDQQSDAPTIGENS